MRICVVSPGVAHAVPRTLAFAGYFEDVHFIDVKGSADRRQLSEGNVRWHHGRESDASGGRIIVGRLLQSLKPDVVVCHFTAGTSFYQCVSQRAAPVAGIAMGQDVLYEGGDLRVPLVERVVRRLALRQLALASAKGVTVANRLREYGVLAPIDVNYWGCELDRFRPQQQAQARVKLGLPLNVRIVLSPRAIEPRLNIHLIVEALPRLLQKIPKLQLVFVGRESPAYRRKVDEAVGTHHLREHVRFDGEVSREALVDYIAASDVAVSAGCSEGFPNTVLEVMACERVCVISRIPQIENVLTDGRNAALCGMTSKSIGDRLFDILTDQAQYSQIADGGRQLVERIGDIRTNGSRFALQVRGSTGMSRTRRQLAELPLLKMFRVMYAAERRCRGL